MLVYDLVLHGYACRVVESAASTSGESEERPTAAQQRLQTAFEQAESYATVATTVSGIALRIARNRTDDLAMGLWLDLTEDEDIDFHFSYMSISALGVVKHHQRESSRVAKPLSETDIGSLWHAGYWLRALVESLPEPARAELGEVRGPPG